MWMDYVRPAEKRDAFPVMAGAATAALMAFPAALKAKFAETVFAWKGVTVRPIVNHHSSVRPPVSALNVLMMVNARLGFPVSKVRVLRLGNVSPMMIVILDFAV